MSRSLAEVVSEFKRNWTRVLEASQIEKVCEELGVLWRDRILNPVQTVQLLLLQILHGNTAMSHLRMFSEKEFTASAYCQARQRLPLELLEKLLEKMRVLVCDGPNERRSCGMGDECIWWMALIFQCQIPSSSEGTLDNRADKRRAAVFR